MINKSDFMLCNSITEEELKNLNGNWKANLKYDGERIIIFKKGDDIFLFNRRGREKSLIYPEVAEELKTIYGDFILDGEIITRDGKFNSLQHRSHLTDKQKIITARENYPITYMIFDILNFDGMDLTTNPLKERIKLLSLFNFDNLKNIGFVTYEDINNCLDYAKNFDCEGIVIKNMDSTYQHKRSNDWLKLKFFKEDVLRVVRYTENPAGIRCEDEKLNAVQVSGQQHKEVKKAIDEIGFCDITISYLEKTANNRYRFISYKRKN